MSNDLTIDSAKEAAYEAFEKYTRENYFKGTFDYRIGLDLALEAAQKHASEYSEDTK